MSHRRTSHLQLPSLASAMYESLRGGYRFATFRQDVLAAFVVSLIALPLSMALSIAVGLPPQHGLYTAIVAGVVAALLGGSRLQVSGPTAAFVVILAPIVADLGLRGIIWCQILAGLFLIGFAVAHLGRLINYVPFPVTTGFTAGIAVVLATLSLNDFLGLGLVGLQGEYIDKATRIITALPDLNWSETAVGMVTLLSVIYAPRFLGKKVPGAIIGVGLGTALALILGDVETIGTRFNYIDTLGNTVAGIPPYLPSFHLPGGDDALWAFPTAAEWRVLLAPALTIAILAALESLLAATVADSLSDGKRHNPNSELNGIGIANIASGLAMGIPATGAIARTAMNINAGAKTPLAAVYHALFILLYLWLFIGLINHIPMASLAALLLFTAYRMSHVHQFVNTLRVAPRSDVWVMLTCFGLTVLMDMVAGVTVGMVLASLLVIKRVTEMTHVELETPEHKKHHKTALPDGVVIYHLQGPLFFATVEKALDAEPAYFADVHTLILDMERVDFVDMSGLVALYSMLRSMTDMGKRVILCSTPEVAVYIRKHHVSLHLAETPEVVETVEDALILCAAESGMAQL